MRTRPAKDEDLKGPLFEPLFAGGPGDKTALGLRRKLSEASSIRTWEEGSSVLFEDDPGDYVLVLLKGRAKVLLEPEAGREELILAIIEPFAIIGELAALDTAPRSASVITLEQCRVSSPAGRGVS